MCLLFPHQLFLLGGQRIPSLELRTIWLLEIRRNGQPLRHAVQIEGTLVYTRLSASGYYILLDVFDPDWHRLSHNVAVYLRTALCIATPAT